MRLIGLSFALLLPSALAGHAQAPAVSANLQPLAFLAGACWSGQQPKGTIDTHCFSTVFGGHFIRDVHEVTGAPKPYAGETLYHWDARQRQIRFTYYNSLGGVSTGAALVEGGRLVFPETYESRDGKTSEMRSVWYQDGPDTYVTTTDLKTDAGWTEQFRVVFKRRTDIRPSERPGIR